MDLSKYVCMPCSSTAIMKADPGHTYCRNNDIEQWKSGLVTFGFIFRSVCRFRGCIFADNRYVHRMMQNLISSRVVMSSYSS